MSFPKLHICPLPPPFWKKGTKFCSPRVPKGAPVNPLFAPPNLWKRLVQIRCGGLTGAYPREKRLFQKWTL